MKKKEFPKYCSNPNCAINKKCGRYMKSANPKIKNHAYTPDGDSCKGFTVKVNKKKVKTEISDKNRLMIIEENLRSGRTLAYIRSNYFNATVLIRMQRAYPEKWVEFEALSNKNKKFCEPKKTHHYNLTRKGVDKKSEESRQKVLDYLEYAKNNSQRDALKMVKISFITMRRIAKANPDLEELYLSFNKEQKKKRILKRGDEIKKKYIENLPESKSCPVCGKVFTVKNFKTPYLYNQAVTCGKQYCRYENVARKNREKNNLRGNMEFYQPLTWTDYFLGELMHKYNEHINNYSYEKFIDDIETDDVVEEETNTTNKRLLQLFAQESELPLAWIENMCYGKTMINEHDAKYLRACGICFNASTILRLQHELCQSKMEVKE